MWRHKMREIRGEVEKKIPKKEMNNPSFLWRLMADFFKHFMNLQSMFQKSS